MRSFTPELASRASIPSTPGVYLFYGEDQADLLYVGKSIDLKKRVASHFSTEGLNQRRVDIRDRIKSIKIIETATELGALLLELHLIKTKYPQYNRRSRRTRGLCMVEYVPNQYPVIKVTPVNSTAMAKVVGVRGLFRSRKSAEGWLQKIAEDHGLCHKRLGIESGSGQCFYSQLDRCRGVCCDQESEQAHDRRLAKAIDEAFLPIWPFENELVVENNRDRVYERFVLERGCLKASTIEVNKKSVLPSGLGSLTFDYDVYKILVNNLKLELVR